MIALTIGTALAFVPQVAEELSTEEGLEAALDRFVEPFVLEGVFGGAVLVSHGEDIVLAKGYGLASHEHGVPNTPDTRFRIASISKLFTSTAIQQLVDRDVLSWDDPVARFLPDFPEGARIRLQHLANHRAGLVDTSDLPGFWEMAKSERTLDELIDLFAHLPLEFEPGTRRSYCNSGYVLLARIVEVASGRDYGTYLREEIFEVAGMRGSGHERSYEVVPDRAWGYRPSLDGEGVSRSLHVDPSNKIGSGSIYSTVLDLHRFARALRAGRIHPGRDPLPSMAGSELGGRRAVWWSGNSWGFCSAWVFLPEEDVLFVVLANNLSQVAFRVVRALAALYFGDPVHCEERREARALPEDSERFVGYYELENGLRMEVARRGSGLVLLWGDRYPYPWCGGRLLPQGGARFFVPCNWADVTFQADDEGRVSGFRLVNTARLEARRVPGWD